MTFLHPALLWLLPLVLVPIVLHLLTLHRLKVVELSTFRFLFDSYVQQRRRMRFLEALLAMLRTLVLLLLILVICRPMVKHWQMLFRGGSGRDVILLVDCSASMNARTAGVSAIERARNAAQFVVDKLKADDRLTLIRVTSRPEEVFSQFNTDAENIRNKIEGLQTAPARANFFAALMHVFGPQAQRHGTPLVYVFTDCQAGNWREVRDQGLERIIPNETAILVVNVGACQPGGVSPGTLRQCCCCRRCSAAAPGQCRASGPFASTGGQFSRGKPADVSLGVFIDDQEIGRTPLTLKAGETAVHKFTYLPSKPGAYRGRFEISQRKADCFPDDDNFLFTLHVVPRLRVLLVNGNRAADPLEDEGLYLRAALTSPSDPLTLRPSCCLGGRAGLTPPERDEGGLEVREIAEAELDAATLRNVDVIVLANCGKLTVQQMGWLHGYAADGGGLLVFPGDRVNPDLYNKQLFLIPGPLNGRLTAARLEAAEGDPAKVETFERLAVIDFAHPALSVFEEGEGRSLKGVRFYRRFPLKLPDPEKGSGVEKTNTVPFSTPDPFSGDTWPLAQFASGVPALVESRYGDARVIVAAFPANSRWTNLPLKTDFVPLVLRLVSHAGQRAELMGPSVVPAGAVAEISTATSWYPASGKVIDGNGHVTPLTFERANARLVAPFEGTAEKGYYRAEVTGGSAPSPQPLSPAAGERGRGEGAGSPAPNAEQTHTGALSFAVNLPAEESDFTALSESQFRDMLPGIQISVIDASAEAQQLHGTLGNEQGVWRPLIVLLFIMIFIEFLFATISRRAGDKVARRGWRERARMLLPGYWLGQQAR